MSGITDRNLDIEDQQAIESDAQLRGREDKKGIDPDEIASKRAAREALQQSAHGDVYVVKTDLEDDDVRNSTPGMREQP